MFIVTKVIIIHNIFLKHVLCSNKYIQNVTIAIMNDISLCERESTLS